MLHLAADVRQQHSGAELFAARIPGTAEFPTLPNFTNSEQQIFGILPTDYQQRTPPAVLPSGIVNCLPGNPNSSGLLLSRWAEVGYFLVPTGNTAGTSNPMPLYSLRRRVRVVLNDPATTALVNTPSALPPAANPRIPTTLLPSRYPEVSCQPDIAQPNYLYFNTPADFTNPLKQTMPQLTVPLGTLNTTSVGPINAQGNAVGPAMIWC